MKNMDWKGKGQGKRGIKRKQEFNKVNERLILNFTYEHQCILWMI